MCLTKINFLKLFPENYVLNILYINMDERIFEWGMDEEDEVIWMKENLNNYMIKYNFEITTKIIRKIFVDEIEKV